MDTTKKLKQFPTRLYQSLPHRADATMDQIHALAANTTGRSVVELSLSPQFRRGHASVQDVIDSLLEGAGNGDFDVARRRLEESLLRAVAPELPTPNERPFWLMVIDALTLARPHARTLTDRSYVHKAGTHSSGRPVTVGHAYSLLVILPERQTGLHRGRRRSPPGALLRSAPGDGDHLQISDIRRPGLHGRGTRLDRHAHEGGQGLPDAPAYLHVAARRMLRRGRRVALPPSAVAGPARCSAGRNHPGTGV